MNVYVGEVAPATACQVRPASVLTCQVTVGRGAPSASAVSETREPAVTAWSPGFLVTFGDVARSSRVIRPATGSDTKTVAPPGSTATAPLPNCTWIPGSTTGFTTSWRSRVRWTVSVPSLSLPGCEVSPASCHTTNASCVVASKPAARGMSVPAPRRVPSRLPVASWTTTEESSPTHTEPVSGSTSVNPPNPSPAGSSTVAATWKVAASIRYIRRLPVSVNHTVPRAASTANASPPASVTERFTAAVAMSTSDRTGPCATSTVEGVRPAVAWVTAAPGTHAPAAAASPSFAVPMPRSG